MKLFSGYRIEYDPTEALEKLRSSYDDAIEELWENLYHQGDVDTASYFAVPTLVSLGELFLVAQIEIAHREKRNPEIPESLKPSYSKAINEALNQKPLKDIQLQGYYVLHALSVGQDRLAKAISVMDIEEILELY
ncbi:hypothetical protein [Desulforhopalus sp. 52FAK]